MAQTRPQPPPTILRMEEVIAVSERHTVEHRNLVDKITACVTPSTATFENTILPLEELRDAQSGEKAVIDALKYCSPSLACQHAVEAAQKASREDHSISGTYDKRLYELVRAVSDRKEGGLDEESRKVLDRELLRYGQLGFGKLDDAAIERRRERLRRVETLEAEFCRNLQEENEGAWFTPEEVDGLPVEALEPTGEDGKAFYSYAAKFHTIMRRANKEQTRRRMAEGMYRVCPENVAIFREVILLRDENAREIGEPNHATSQLPYRLAQSMEWLEEFLDSVTDTLVPPGRAEYERVVAVRRQCLLAESGQESSVKEADDEKDESMPTWDYLYYSAKGDNTSNPVDHKAISEYFPLRHTFAAMLELFSSCLQLRFDPLSPDELVVAVWHPDVEGWAVWDERPETKGDFIGYLFADLLERPNKYKGNQSVNLQPGYLKRDGTRVYPANTLMCNFHLSPSRAYALSHQNVVTMFHELGHSMHDLVSRTRFSRFHGYSVPLELGEGIGMMLEQWCWLPDVLRRLSLHYTRVDPALAEAWLKDNPGKELPPEKIPETLVTKLVARRPGAIRFQTLGILVTVLFDIIVHSPASREALLQLDQEAVYASCFEKVKFRRPPDNTWPYATEGTLFAGYDAGYYAYTCAQVLAADLFESTFATDPLSPTAWQIFRTGILEPGGSHDERTMVKEFLGGRPMSPEALFRMLGLKKVSR